MTQLLSSPVALLRSALLQSALATILLGLLLSPNGALAQTEAPGEDAITATDLLRVQQISDVTISPDGRTAAYVVTSIVETPEGERPYAYRRQLYSVPANGRSAPMILTRSEAPSTQPAWHPDSDRIAFVRPVNGTPQVFILPAFGGEPYQLTDMPHGATSPSWSPGGNQLLFASSVPRNVVAEEIAVGDTFDDERSRRTAADTLAGTEVQTQIILRDSVTLDALDTLPVGSDSVQILADSLNARIDTVRQTVDIDAPADPDGSLLQVRKWLGERRSANDPKVMNRLDFQGERSLDPKLSFRHHFVVDVPSGVMSGSPERPEPRAVTSGFRNYGSASWLPSGSQIIVSGTPPTEVHPDRVRQRDLYVSEVPGVGERPDVRRLLRIERHALYNPKVTSDGTTIAFAASSLDQSGYAQTEIGLFALDGQTKPRLITTEHDRSISQMKWSPDGWYLYAVNASEGGFPLIRFAPFARPNAPSDTTGADETDKAEAPAVKQAAPNDSGTDVFTVDSTMVTPVKPEVLTGATQGIRSFDATDATLVYTATSVSNPYELYTSTVRGSRARAISSHNASWLRDKTIAGHRKIEVMSNTQQIDAWVIRPPGLSEGENAPLLVEMHGGPSAMWGPGEATMWHEFQMLAARGYAIVYANPRGSGGYGLDFKAANFQDWGTGPMNDVLAAADVAAELEWIDGERQVLTGGSYAGYLTAWIVSQTDRFDAAVAQRGVYDLATFFGEGNAWRLVPTHFGGYPWEGAYPSAARDSARRDSLQMPVDSTYFRADAPRGFGLDSLIVDSLRMAPRDALLRNSPQTYVRDIQTPLLILHADDDLRTGVIQSELLYKSLKVLGREVEYVRYPNAGHDLSRTGDPQHRVDRLLRIYEFLTRWTSGEAESKMAAGTE